MKILFKEQGIPRKSGYVKRRIAAFGRSYDITVREIINTSTGGINRKVFFQNLAKLMPNFRMTRSGPFRGVEYSGDGVKDPNGQIAACWNSVGNDVIQLRNYLDRERKGSRIRVLVEMRDFERKKVTSELWEIFKRLEPLCRGKTTLGLVAASKVLFSVLPEVALPIDNSQWQGLFGTIDYGDIIALMAAEITEWEKRAGHQLNLCDPQHNLTLPAIYNVMAMKARP